MMMKFSCSQCAAPLSAPESAAGQQGPCPQCGALVTAPVVRPTRPAAAPAQTTSRDHDQPPSSMKSCPLCHEEINGDLLYCEHCQISLPWQARRASSPMAEATSAPASPAMAAGAAVPPVTALPKDAGWPAITNYVNARRPLGLQGNLGRTIGWFALANAAVLLSLTLISGGELLEFAPLVLVMGCAMPFIMLLSSKWLAQRAHNMIQIKEGEFSDNSEEHIYCLVHSLAARANLPTMPEVWVYASEDMNAFATGPGRGNSMVAFSSGLLDTMDQRGIAAVAAHEIAHIANGDMLTLSLVQSVVNAVTLLITIPLWCIKAVAFFSDEVSVLMYWVINACSWIITAILLFLGNLVVMAFSRKREYAADELASRLIDADSMIHALEVLGSEVPLFPKEQKSYAAFKINNAIGWASFLSTHPSIEDRIARLMNLRDA